MIGMPENPFESMKHHLRQRLHDHARSRWQLSGIDVRFRGRFAYVEARLHGGAYARLCRLRFDGPPHTWGFAIRLPDEGIYQDSLVPSGYPAGSPEEALDYACAFLFADPDAHTTPPPHATDRSDAELDRNV
ncbi:hypothetical protein [Nonomuraea sp. NPDC003214]